MDKVKITIEFDPKETDVELKFVDIKNEKEGGETPPQDDFYLKYITQIQLGGPHDASRIGINGTFGDGRLYHTVERKGVTSLYHANLVYKDDIVASVMKGSDLYGIRKIDDRWHRLVQNEEPVLIPSLGGLPAGDMMGMAPDTRFIQKFDDWSNGDYQRIWGVSGKRCSIPIQPKEGILDRQIYNWSFIDWESQGWSCKTKYVALAWLFDVDEYKRVKANQRGNIYPVWASSNDMVSWAFPFGDAPVIEPNSNMVLVHTNPEILSNKINVRYSLTNYKHNMFGSTKNPITQVHLAEISREDFERGFA